LVGSSSLCETFERRDRMNEEQYEEQRLEERRERMDLDGEKERS
jgi:hypothetical protein